LRREIGGNLHAESNLSSLGGETHTTLWSAGLRIGIICPVLGRPVSSVVSLWSLSAIQMKGILRGRFQIGPAGYLGYLNGLKVILELVTEWV
jgi:hypothetical protein